MARDILLRAGFAATDGANPWLSAGSAQLLTSAPTEYREAPKAAQASLDGIGAVSRGQDAWTR